MTSGFRTYMFFLFIISVLSTAELHAEESQRSEQQVRAAMVYNIAKYVTWPFIFSNDSNQFTTCIIGQSRTIPAWNGLNGKVMHGKTINVRRIIDLDDLILCQLIYIDPTEKKNIPRILATTRDIPVLTISEIEGFSSYGGMITLRIDNNRMVFDINLKNARAAGLSLSSNILKLATEVIK